MNVHEQSRWIKNNLFHLKLLRQRNLLQLFFLLIRCREIAAQGCKKMLQSIRKVLILLVASEKF